MTSVTLLTHPSPPVLALGLVLGAPLNATWYWDMVGYVFSQYPALGEKGLAGYSAAWQSYPARVGETVVPLNAVAGRFVLLDSQDAADMHELWNPVLAHVSRTWPEAVQQFTVTAYPSTLAWRQSIDDASQAGINMYGYTHLMTAQSMKDAGALAQACE